MSRKFSLKGLNYCLIQSGGWGLHSRGCIECLESRFPHNTSLFSCVEVRENVTGTGSQVIPGVRLFLRLRAVFIKRLTSQSRSCVWLEIVIWFTKSSVLPTSWKVWCWLSLFSSSGLMVSRLVYVLKQIPCAKNSQRVLTVRLWIIEKNIAFPLLCHACSPSGEVNCLYYRWKLIGFYYHSFT